MKLWRFVIDVWVVAPWRFGQRFALRWRLRRLARARRRMMAHPLAQVLYESSPAFREMLRTEARLQATIRRGGK